MAFRLVDGKIMKVDGKFSFREVNSLTYQVKGTVFPEATSVNFGLVAFLEMQSTTPNSVTINYGDGFSITKQFELSGSIYKIRYSNVPSDSSEPWYIPKHTFLDPSNTGMRNISFQFQNPVQLSYINFYGYRFYGSLPEEINKFTNCEYIRYYSLNTVSQIPDSLPPNVKTLDINSTLVSKLPKIPDSFFSSSLINLKVSRAFDLSDEIASNLFKIDQLKNTLKSLDFSESDMIDIPINLRECVLLNDLRLLSNKYTEVPDIANHLPNLKIFYIGSAEVLINNSIPILVNENIETLLLWFTDYLDLSDIPLSFAGLFSLKNLQTFNLFIPTNARFNEFIDQFYILCTTNGSITNNSGQFATYPNRFRNIVWGHGSLSFTGTKVAPAGYVQGVSNGTPANEGEKVYVLQNQYGHVITHA